MIGHYASLTSLLFALLSTAIGHFLFRLYYVRGKKIYLAAALGTFLPVPLFNYLALANLTLAIVYMSTALVHVLVLIMSYLFLKEHLTSKQYISMTFILVGILVFNL